jgi:hypothetical protein
MFSGTRIYQLIEDSDYDAVEDPVDRDKLENLFIKKGITVYPCLHCGRLLVEWDKKGNLTIYRPEGNQDIAKSESSLGQEDHPQDGEPAKAPEFQDRDRPDDLRLKELEAMAEAAYDDMYDSLSPVACYSDAKEALYDAIGLAERLGRNRDAERLKKRLQHIKNVFRHQFS